MEADPTRKRELWGGLNKLGVHSAWVTMTSFAPPGNGGLRTGVSLGKLGAEGWLLLQGEGSLKGFEPQRLGKKLGSGGDKCWNAGWEH
jgi:hypothetical protein